MIQPSFGLIGLPEGMQEATPYSDLELFIICKTLFLPSSSFKECHLVYINAPVFNFPSSTQNHTYLAAQPVVKP